MPFWFCSPSVTIRRSSHSRVNSWLRWLRSLSSFSRTERRASLGVMVPSVWIRIKSSGTLG